MHDVTGTLEVIPAFPTLIGRWIVPDAGSMNQELRALILAEEAKYSSLGRSNIGGWHSRTDFLNHPEPAVAALTTWITWAANQMIDATAGSRPLTGTRYLGFSGAERGALVIGATMTVVDRCIRSVRTTTAGCGPRITWPPTSGKSMMWMSPRAGPMTGGA